MLKIKDGVNLKELEKYGYKLGEETLYVPYGEYGKIFNKNLSKTLKVSTKLNNELLYIVIINPKNKQISLAVTTKTSSRNFVYNNDEIVKSFITDLIKIKAGLVEKVENEK